MERSIVVELDARQVADFARRHGLGLITPDLARELAELAGLRNILVHRYEQVGVDQLYATLKASLPLWRAYLEHVSARLG